MLREKKQKQKGQLTKGKMGPMPSTTSSPMVTMLVLAGTGKLRRNDISSSRRLSDMFTSREGIRTSNFCLFNPWREKKITDMQFTMHRYWGGKNTKREERWITLKKQAVKVFLDMVSEHYYVSALPIILKLRKVIVTVWT